MKLSSLAAVTLLFTIACQPMNSPQTTPIQQPAVPPHSWSNPEEARVEHLSLDLSVDFPAKQLVGTATLRLATAPGARKLVLDARDLTIERVLSPTAELQYRMGTQQATFGAPLEITLPSGTKSVTIQYRTSPKAAALQWLDPAQTAGKRWPFLLSQSQSILARTWVPIQDTPTVRFTYDATIRVPKDLMAIMSAENPTERNATGVYRFRMPQPIPSYLLAIAVGDIAFRPLDGRSGVYAEQSVVDAAAREFADIPRMMTAAEQLYGPYRWGRYDVLVLPPSFPFGGMENPRLTFLTPTLIAGDRSLVSVVAHELAHSWSGNLVTNATWNDFWLNEGFTTYLERRISEQLYGRDHAEMLWTLGGKDLQDEFDLVPPEDERLKVDLTGRDPDDGSTQVPYEKGSLFLRTIEERVGRAKLDAFLRSYFDEFAFKPMTTEKFLQLLHDRLLAPNHVTEAELQVDAWIHQPGLPSNAPKPRSDSFAIVEAQAAAFASGTAPSSLATSGWNTHQWLHFIHSLPKPMTTSQMSALDRQFHFTQSGNSEILEAWLEHAIDYGYADAYTALEDFLLRQGRRKYLKPLYTKLAATPAGKERARAIYAKARPGYHSVSTQTIDEILK